MIEVYIEYNPYRVTTKILVEGREPKVNSKLNITNKRLQEWIDNLPDILAEEYSSNQFYIKFKGTLLDYEDVVAITSNATNKGINIEVHHIPAKEVEDKEKIVQNVFNMIQNSPYEEFKRTDIINAFKLAKSQEFRVDVVATMSAGKSTLINSLLGKKLMPSKNEACTATIIEIKDNNDKFCAKAFGENGTLLESYDNPTLEDMDKLNADKNISTIKVEGNIPFVNSSNTSLVLVDTPGPNNSIDISHKKRTKEMISKSSKALVLFVINGTQSCTDDQNNLLDMIADSMKEGGKQSRDRFIFVVNKLDNFRKGEDNVEIAIKHVKSYLEDKGIDNPNIYLMSALTALSIRTILSESNDDNDDEEDEDVYDAKGKVKKFNRNTDLHFEKYASLPYSSKKCIEQMLLRAKENESVNEQALIHTGIISLEEAISIYVNKYAKTAKIKNVVDTFKHHIESAQSLENTKQQILINEEKKKQVIEKIDSINAKLNSGTEAKQFKEEIDKINYDTKIMSAADYVIAKAQAKVSKLLIEVLTIKDCKLGIEEVKSKLYKATSIPESSKIKIEEAEKICRDFNKLIQDIQIQVEVQLEQLIKNDVQEHAITVLETYKNKLSSLVDDANIGDIQIDPFKIMSGELQTDIDNIISSASSTEEIKVGDEYIHNENKRWYKPWTWLEEDGHYKEIMEKREYIDKKRLEEALITPIEENLYENRDSAVDYAKRQTELLKIGFSTKFDELDGLLKNKLEELKSCSKDEKDIEFKIKEATEKLNWLKKVEGKINEILDI